MKKIKPTILEGESPTLSYEKFLIFYPHFRCTFLVLFYSARFKCHFSKNADF